MSLSCYCDVCDDDWTYTPPDDYSTLNTSRRKRCCSCKKLIDIGAICSEFHRSRPPVSDIEDRIMGCEIDLASYWMCEECSDLFFSLEELGFCVLIGAESMRDLVREYADMVKHGYL